MVQFRDWTLPALGYPYVFLDATFCKARIDHRIVSPATVVADGVGVVLEEVSLLPELIAF